MHTYNFSLYFLFFLILAACSDNSAQKEKELFSKQNILLTPCPPLDSAILYPSVRLENYTYTRNKMIFTPQKMRLGGMTPFSSVRKTTKTKKGNHLHLCIDNTKHHISNQNIFDYPLENGQHKLVAFIARSFYESIKNPTAILAKEITIRNGELIASKNLPFVDIVYNAPMGSYKEEEAEKILLDFVLVGTVLAEGGNSVKVTIDQNHSFTINKWQAYFIEGLRTGEHEVKLELLDPTGKQIAAPTSQKFVIKATPAIN